MFRKIVSNLHYSPALVGQLGFYARRLKKEEATRRIGLIFTALALTVQSLAVFTPAEAANAASAADFIRGGVSSKQELLASYDRDDYIRGVLGSLGITRRDLASTELKTVCEEGHYNWSRTSLYSAAQGQRSWSFKRANGTTATTYYRPMELTQGGPCHKAYVGNSATFGWFAMKKDCGNLLTSKPPRAPNPQAFCVEVTAKQLERTSFKITGRANTKDGAKILAYQYEITHGKNSKTKKFNSAKLTHSFVYENKSPGKYNVVLTVVTSKGKKSSADCRDTFVIDEKPVAVCVEASAEILNRRIVSLSGKASAANGAKIKKYTFVVKDNKGNVVKTVSVKSSKKHVTADSFKLKPGEYVVRLTVQTSVGDKTDADCKARFSIKEKEVCAYNPSLPINSPDCQPCPDNPDVWIKDADCHAEVIFTKTTSNMTQGMVDATQVVAQASDKITYTLSAQNRGIVSENVTMKESLADVLEYAKIVDMGGANYDDKTKTLTWPEFKLAANEKQSRTIAIEVMSDIPATNTGKSDEASYDCRMVNTFGNATEIDMNCPTEKVVVEQVVKELPETGPRENMLFAGIVLAVVVYFYARSRQLGKEVRLIRRELHAGTI